MTPKPGSRPPRRRSRAEILREADEALAMWVDPSAVPLTWTWRPDAAVEPHEPGDAWVIGMEPYLANDNGVLYRGREIDFALRVEPVSLAPAEAAPPRVLSLGNGVYHVEGTVLARDDHDVCALDFGLLGWSWFSPGWMQPGAGFAGDVVLEPDLSAAHGRPWDPRFPALIYPWRIDRIVLEHAERIPASEEDCIRCGNPELKTNSPDRRTLREIQVVNWEKDQPRREEGRPSREMGRYLLHCTLLSRIPRMMEMRDLSLRREAAQPDA